MWAHRISPSVCVQNILSVVVLFGILCELPYSSADYAAAIEHDDICGDIRPQNGLVIQQMTGIWYGNELIHHDTPDSLENRTDTAHCIIVEISQESTTVRPQLVPYSPPNEDANAAPVTPSVYKKQLDHNYHSANDDGRHSVEYLRLIWDDSRTGVAEYTLQFNATSRGTWRTAPSAGGHYQSTVRDPSELTILVMKAVGDHVVLTRCETVPRKRLQSITLSRVTDSLNKEELGSVRKLLDRRHLSIYATEPLCNKHNSASKSASTVAAITAALFIATCFVN